MAEIAERSSVAELPQEGNQSLADPSAEARRPAHAPPETQPEGEACPHIVSESTGITLVRIPAGGSTVGSASSPRSSPVHYVTISRPFYLSICPITQAQYHDVMDHNGSVFDGSDCPAECVSWHDAVCFCRALSERDGDTYRLPTEAEWEYACRAGATTTYYYGDSPLPLDKYAWFDANSNGRTHNVGQKRPNAWGLHDLHGNVWEWCQDRYGPCPSTPQTDPQGPPRGSYRVLHGGHWASYARYCGAAHRAFLCPGARVGTVGFRVVRETA